MSLLSCLEALRYRVSSFRALQSELTSRDMPSTQVWEPLIEKYNDPK